MTLPHVLGRQDRHVFISDCANSTFIAYCPCLQRTCTHSDLSTLLISLPLQQEYEGVVHRLVRSSEEAAVLAERLHVKSTESGTMR